MHLYQLIKLEKSIMKKLAIASAVLALSASSAMAADDAFYVKAGGFGNMGMGIKLQKDFSPFTTLDRKGEHGKYGYGGTLGFGYHLMDNVRGEINASILSSRYKGGGWQDAQLKPEGLQVGQENLNELSISGGKLMINSYVDVINLGSAKLYAVLGVGSSYVKGEVKGQQIATIQDGKPSTKDADAVTYDYKFNPISYEAGAGVSYEITDTITAQFGYTIENFGMPGDRQATATESKDSKSVKLSWEDNVSESPILNHNVNLALRFSL
jgi:opacity protein-like surface antigen